MGNWLAGPNDLMAAYCHKIFSVTGINPLAIVLDTSQYLELFFFVQCSWYFFI